MPTNWIMQIGNFLETQMTEKETDYLNRPMILD